MATKSAPNGCRRSQRGLWSRLEERKMTVTQSAAGSSSADRIAAIMAALRISERTARTYLDVDALDGLADSLAASLLPRSRCRPHGATA